IRFRSRGTTRIRMPAISATSGDNVVMLTVNVGPRPETAAPTGRAPTISATNANTDTSPTRYLRMSTAEHRIFHLPDGQVNGSILGFRTPFVGWVPRTPATPSKRDDFGRSAHGRRTPARPWSGRVRHRSRIR